MKASYGKDFFGRWCVMVGPKCIAAYATKEEAKKAAEEYNNRQ